MSTEDNEKHHKPAAHTPLETRALVISGLALVAAGCLPAPQGGYAFYALLPYAAAVVLVGLCAMTPLGLDFKRRAPERPTSERRSLFRARLLAATIASGLSAAGELVHILMMGIQGTQAADAATNPALASVVLAAAFTLLSASACACLAFAWRQGRVR